MNKKPKPNKSKSSSNQSLEVFFNQYWLHTRQCINERLWFTNIYAVVAAAILALLREISSSQQEYFVPALLLTSFGFMLSVIGFLVVVSTSLGYLHYIADITMIVYHWDKMEFYKHPGKPIRFGDVHRWLYEITTALFLTLLLYYIGLCYIDNNLLRLLLSVLAFIATLSFIQLFYWLRWSKYFDECWKFARILKDDTEGRYRSDWDKWFRNPNFQERIIEDAREKKVRDLIKAFSPDNMTDARWQNFQPDEMYKLGKTAADLLGSRKIVLGADSRKNSLKMLKKFKKGYKEKGGKVLDCGINCTTPMIEFLGRKYDLTSVMITASHLDETWQGIKITVNPENPENITKEGNIKKKALDDYIENFTEDKIGLSLTVDYFEGSTAHTFPRIAEKKGIKMVKELNNQMSGDFTFFPTLSPDPSFPENLVFIIKVMKTNGSQLGVAFDGDGDRYVIILKDRDTVKAVDPVLLTALSATCYENPGVFVLDPFVVPAEKAITSAGHEMVRARRGRPIMIKTIKELKSRGKTVHKGVEGSYHSYDSENFDDGIRQVLEFCRCFKENIDREEVKKYREEAKKYIVYDYTLEMRVECKNDELFRKKVIPALVTLGQTRGLKVDTSDGIWVKDSFIARKSSRENVVSFLFYGKDVQNEMEQVRDAIKTVYEELAKNLENEFNIVQQKKEELFW